jgi:hypothetical protein
MNQQDLEEFLRHLPVDGKVSATTQRVCKTRGTELRPPALFHASRSR